MTDTATTQTERTHVRIVNGGVPEFITWSAAQAEMEAGMRDHADVVTMSVKGDHVHMTLRNGDRVEIRSAMDADYLAGEPEWGTLKGIQAPFTVWLEEAESGLLYTGGDRRKVRGRPVRIVRKELRGGLNWGTTSDGQEVGFWGPATRMWRHQ